jgi:hypothetical protein
MLLKNFFVPAPGFNGVGLSLARHFRHDRDAANHVVKRHRQRIAAARGIASTVPWF